MSNKFNNIQYEFIANKRVFAFKSKEEFLIFLHSQNVILIALNAEKLSKNDDELDNLINSNIGYPDGIGAVWALRRKGLKAIKIAGAEFWLDLVEKYYQEKSFFFIGSSQEIIEMTVAKIKKEFPQVRIVGYSNGFLGLTGKESLLEEFHKNKPDVVFVAMGSPKQEFLMEFFLQHYSALYMGLGGSFDVYSGTKKRAPRIFISLGLEWLYRLFKEPSRIGRQINVAIFFFKLIFKKF